MVRIRPFKTSSEASPQTAEDDPAVSLTELRWTSTVDWTVDMRMLAPVGKSGVPRRWGNIIDLPGKEDSMTPNIADIIRHHVSLEIRCLDRLYLHAYLPTLQTSGGLCYFLHDHLGYPYPSPALFKPIHDRFVTAVDRFAAAHQVPVVPFRSGQRKDDIVAEYRTRFTAHEGVVVLGVAQEKMAAFRGQKRPGPAVSFSFSRHSVAVNHYYFYVQDRDWGPAFLKIGTYVPYPVKICLNGHEWAKQQLRRAGIPFESLDNGFLTCAAPERLQAICDRLAPADIQRFFDRWSHRLPWPLTAADRAAGYEHRLAINQLEASLTQIFDHPVQGRHFFEALIRDNLELGRPDRVSLLFPRRRPISAQTPPPRYGYRSRVITDGVQPSLHVEYKSSHVKQYFKDQRGLRTETTINNPMDFEIRKAVTNLPHLRDIGDAVNRKLLEAERVSHHCVLSQDALDRLQRPTHETGQRAPALRFGDPRVMALCQAITAFLHLPRGFRNRDLRRQVEALLGRPYSSSQMTYDLRRLRLKGLIHRIPGTHRYTATTYGLHVAFFYSKLYLRILRPQWPALTTAADDLPRPLRAALDQLDAAIDKIREEAALVA
jgi:hypothetical protein